MKFWWRWLLFWLLLGFGLRVFMWITYPDEALSPDGSQFFWGLVNDVQSFLMVSGAIALAGLSGQRGLRAAAYLAAVVVLIVLVAEVFFWLEFESRLDRLVFHYLAYPKEVLFFLEEQFFVSLFLLPVLLAGWLLMTWLEWPRWTPYSRRVQMGIVASGLVVAVAGAPFGHSPSRIASELASNGYLGVLTDARYAEHDIPWLADRVTPARATTPVGQQADSLALSVRQEVQGKKHVVLIIEESFAGAVWENPSLRAQYLPNFSALAAQSVSFSNVYATGSRTTRGMEALLNGFMPLPGISTTERARFERLPSLPRAMAEAGFLPVFLYGGWPGFSNFFAYWKGIGFEKLWSREDFSETFETSWGVADEALFKRVIAEMNVLTQAQPQVFLATLTVSHHRPYDFPAGAISLPASARRSEYAMAYADHALGEFFTAARQTPWFKDTVFIVAADHGLYPRGDALIPVGSYHIPMLIHAQGLTPRQLEGLGSSVSLPKTLMSLLQIETNEPFRGADMLCDCDTVVPVEAGYNIGLLERDRLGVVTRYGTYEQWQFDTSSRRLTHQPLIEDEAIAGRAQVLEAFAPAFQFYYGSRPEPSTLAGLSYAPVIGERE